jgi:hypothetical protein
MTDEGLWFELYPNSHPPAVGRYRDQSEAERAGRRLRKLQPDLQFVAIMEVDIADGERSMAREVSRV